MDSAPVSIPFYATCIALVCAGVFSWGGRYAGWGLPALAVLATTGVWYVGDALYNDYQEYVGTLGHENLDAAWWQVALFIGAFCFFVKPLNRSINYKVLKQGSMMMRYFETRALEHSEAQRQISRMALGLFAAWGLLMGLALVRVDFDFKGLFAPYLGYKAEPWSRSRMGGGIDAILSFAGYLQVFLTAGVGVIAAVAMKWNIRSIAIAICVLALPYYIFDRTRNTMLATILPGLLSWVFFRLRGGLFVKGVALVAAFLAMNAWFTFVMANRSEVSIAAAAASETNRLERIGKHEGLNMFGELGWVNMLTSSGAYSPNFGARYFAELVNPIPRVLWKSKPEIGIDYSKARGQGGDSEDAAGVHATVSTGMIGQGVVNFGGLLGPVAAAALMACWVALLARQDLLGRDPIRLLLYSVGMTLTFNLGRDITLLVLYPFFFGLVLVKVIQYFIRKKAEAAALESEQARPGKMGGLRSAAGPVSGRRPAGRRAARTPRAVDQGGAHRNALRGPSRGNRAGRGRAHD